MPPVRATFQGTPDDLADALRPYAPVHTFVKYVERLTDPIDTNQLIKHKNIVGALWSLQKNMSFTRTVMEKALDKLCDMQEFRFTPTTGRIGAQRWPAESEPWDAM